MIKINTFVEIVSFAEYISEAIGQDILRCYSRSTTSDFRAKGETAPPSLVLFMCRFYINSLHIC